MASKTVRRGEVYRVNLEPTQGSEQQGRARPCVIISITPFNNQFRTVGVVPLSSSARAHEPVAVGAALAGENWVALCYQLRTVDKSRLIKRLGDMSASDMLAIEAGVKQVYGLN